MSAGLQLQQEMSAATVLRIALATISDLPPPRPGEPCSRCGSYGFNIHQRTWKSIRDPQANRVQAIRYRCKRCGAVWRRYGEGVGTDRQSRAVKELSVLLYCLGLSYQGTSDVLDDLGCALAPATIRKNVIGSHPQLARRKPRLFRVGTSEIAGQDGRLTLRVVGIPTTSRWLEIAIAPGPGADELSWRVTRCAESLSSGH